MAQRKPAGIKFPTELPVAVHRRLKEKSRLSPTITTGHGRGYDKAITMNDMVVAALEAWIASGEIDRWLEEQHNLLVETGIVTARAEQSGIEKVT